jgi:hypothetical protein
MDQQAVEDHLIVLQLPPIAVLLQVPTQDTDIFR